MKPSKETLIGHVGPRIDANLPEGNSDLGMYFRLRKRVSLKSPACGGKNCTSGSVRGARGDPCPYRNGVIIPVPDRR